MPAHTQELNGFEHGRHQACCDQNGGFRPHFGRPTFSCNLPIADVKVRLSSNRDFTTFQVHSKYLDGSGLAEVLVEPQIATAGATPGHRPGKLCSGLQLSQNAGRNIDVFLEHGM